jgi:DnaK suppressor protein
MDKKLSKQFIENQKKKLENDKIKILLQIEELKKNDPFSDPEHASDNAAVDTDVREQVGHDTIEAQIKDMQKRLSDIDLSLKKVFKGSYGICDKCRSAIPIARLELIPEAHFCVECERKLRK